MTNLDDKILNAIANEHASSDEDYSKELGLFGLIGKSFKGTHKWIVFIVFLLVFIFLILTVYCGYNFYHATELSNKLNWMAGGFLFFIGFALLRLWYFMELNRLSLKREIKRVELQVSLLVKKLDVLEK